MKTANIIDKLGISMTMAPTRAIQLTSEFIEATNVVDEQLAAANTVIKGLGGKAMDDADTARIVAKYMVGQVIAKQAPSQKLALERANALIARAPYVKRMEIEGERPAPVCTYVPKTDRRKGDRNNIRKEALELCKNNSTLSNAELAKLISTTLKISYSNGYYYAQRVFVRS